MTRLQNLVALSTACQTAHDDAVQAGDHETEIELRYMGKTIARHISRLVTSKAVASGERVS